jgi:release factor H-coupled RctB family protein
MKLEGILKGAAFPDLHPGRGIPVGAAFLSENIIYPALIGNDIGCGMTLSAADIPRKKLKLDRLIRFFGDEPKEQLQKTAAGLIASMENPPEDPLKMLGTLGHGNHFAEILTIDQVEDLKEWEMIAPGTPQIFLLIHSGSRYYGEQLWARIAAKHGSAGIAADSDDGKSYLTRHDQLLHWAEFNRYLITKAFGNIISCKFQCVANTIHNSITKTCANKWIHRKGASEAMPEKPLVIAGSRGSCSYVVKPAGIPEEYLFSLAHGSGRKWTCSSTRTRMQEKYSVKELLKTRIGSHVLCPDKELLFEEAPEAYKKVEHVIADLQQAGLIHVIARLKPLFNCKP